MAGSDDPKLGDAPTAAAGSLRTVASVDPNIASAQTVASVDPKRPVLAPAALTPVQEAMYLRLDELARGGLGKISRARDVRTGRIVAIKEVIASSEDAAVRFAREAMITATLQHPSIVPVYEVGRWPSGEPFYAMKLVRGQSFDKVIAAARDLDARIALVSHVLAVADALAYAHGERVIHRDLKPHNVLCGSFGETVVIDWGLARRLDEQDATATSLHRRTSAAPGETYVGAVMGTPAYMPPEQASGKRVDERADVYAIGAMMYHLLAGAPAYSGKTLDELLHKVKSGPPRRLAELVPEVPADLAAIVERAMAPDPEARYRTAAELATDLRRFTTGQLVLAHRYTVLQRLRRHIARHRAAFGVATVALAALILVVSVAFAGVLSARDDAKREQGRAEAERARADHEREEAQRQLVAAHIDRARIELVPRPRTALAFVTAAAEVGGLDPTLRYLAALVLDAIPNTRVLPSEQIVALEGVPGSHDVIVGSESGMTRWNPDTDRTVWNLADQSADILAIDANRLVTVRPTGFFVLDAATGKDLQAILLPPGKTLVGLLALDPTRRWASAITTSSVELVDLEAARLVASIPITEPARTPHVSPDGQRVAVTLTANKGASLPIMRIIDRTGRVIRELCTQCETLRPVGSNIAIVERVVGRQQRVLVVDWAGKTVGELVAGSSAEAGDLASSPDGRLLGIVYIDGLIEVHDLARGLQWRTTIPNRVSEIRFDRHGRLWVLGTYDQTYVFDAATGIELGRWAAGGLAMVLADDGERIAVGGMRKGVASWRVDAKSVTAIAPSPARVRRFVFLDDGRIAVSSDDGALTIVEPDGAMRLFAKHDQRVVSLQRTADGALLSSARDGTTVVRDLATGRELERYALGPHAAISPDGKQLAVDGPGNTVQLIDRTTKASRTLATFPDEVSNIRWSPDGTRLAAIDNSSQIIVWAADGTKVKDVPPLEMGVDIVFSNDGRWLGRIANTTQNVLYSLVPGGKDLELESSAVRTHTLTAAIAFSPDDQRVALADQGRVRIWNLPTATLERTLTTGSDTYALAFSADGRLLYAGGVARTITAWDVARGISYGEQPTTSDVYGLVFDKERRRLGVQTLGPALVWTVPQMAVDVPALRQIASCVNELNPVTGVATPIDVAACNSLSRP